MKPLSKRAGDLVMFPFSKIKPTTKSIENSEEANVIGFKKWNLLSFGSDIIGFFDTKMNLNNSFNEIMDEFVYGSGRSNSKGIIEDSLEEDIFFQTAKELKKQNIISDIGLDENDDVLETDLFNPIHEFFSNAVLDFFSEDAWQAIRKKVAIVGLKTYVMPANFTPPEKLIMTSPPAQLTLERGIDMPQQIYQKMYVVENNISQMTDQICETLVRFIKKNIKRK